ncbi:MAG TPA: cohesin domain-containing protein, partial [Candidatus Bathyarchaeia archaeon]
TLLNPEAPKTGSGTLATITFKIIAAPPSGQTLSSLIELKDKDTKMVDSNADEIPKASYDKISGNFQYSAPPPPLYLTIQPSKVVAAKIGDIVTINVDIKLVETDLQVVAVQFKLSFDPAILSITSANIVEGGFFKGFGTTFFVSVTGDDYAKVGVLLLPTADGDYPPTASGFPSGNGTLATLSFTVKGLPQTPTEFPLTISGAKILDSSVSNVPPRRLESGILLAPTRFEDLNGDGAIDIQDLTIWGLAFGSSPTGPTSTRWDPRADLDHNDIINILDGVKIAIVFGT